MARRFTGLIGEAQRLAEKHNESAVIILLIQGDTGIIRSVSYGRDKRWCARGRRLAQRALRAVEEERNQEIAAEGLLKMQNR